MSDAIAGFFVRDQRPGGALASPEEAPRSLLRGGSPYDCRPSNESLGSYQADLVSFPNDVSSCPLLTEGLPSDDCRYLEEQSELMLAECINADTGVEPFWDPKLRYKKKCYNNLVRRLLRAENTTQPSCSTGIPPAPV